MTAKGAAGGGRAESEWRKRVFRCRKEDSAYLYAIFEAHEGVAVASTLRHATGDLHRDVELQFEADFTVELERIIEGLRAEGIELHEVGPMGDEGRERQ